MQSYRGTAEKCKFEGETVRHFNAGKLAVFELKAPGHKREDVEVSIISKLSGLLIESRENDFKILSSFDKHIWYKPTCHIQVRKNGRISHTKL